MAKTLSIKEEIAVELKIARKFKTYCSSKTLPEIVQGFLFEDSHIHDLRPEKFPLPREKLGADHYTLITGSDKKASLIITMEASDNMKHQENEKNTATDNWKALFNSLTNGKNIIDISEKGIDVNFLGFTAGIGVLTDRKPESTNAGLKAEISTPWGSTASAGFQGNLGRAGVGGGLWARGALTPEVAAKAGLGGVINSEHISGGLIAGAKTPITGEHVANLSGDFNLVKTN
ncbi:uncharacterized protein LOC105693920 isoform X2 [Athalia rosae]|uniref:uncharacterized protein LOC105693920 isoform X2 n=1 Tax=Athalia rosae TaxID=37344 RepID=UPI0020343370|nr:uncharacterized protein LOC105693920 isoform X2 [Athalia rosae]